MNWLKKAQIPSVIIIRDSSDDILVVLINRQRYAFRMNNTQKLEFKNRLKYNKGRALSYLKIMERVE